MMTTLRPWEPAELDSHPLAVLAAILKPLSGISWHTSQQFAADLGEQPVRLAYDRGTLEITTPSFEHERLNRLLANIVQAIAFGKDFPIEPAGSTDF